MIPRSVLGLTAAQEDIYFAALTSSHQIRVRVRVLDRDEQAIADLYPQILSGAVQYDTSQDVTRSLSIQFLDPSNKLHFDATNPSDGALFADNFIAVDYGVWVADLNRWVDCPVFCGPLTRFTRNGPVVDVEAQGKETLGLDPHLATRHFVIRKGTSVKTAIKKVMGEFGEKRFSLDMITGRLVHNRSVVTGEQPWQVCVGGSEDGHGNRKPPLMARAGNSFYLFYDGRGVLTARRRNSKVVFTFKHDKHLTSVPGYEYDVLSFRNHAIVRGGKGKNATKKAHGIYTLPAAHPLSPYALRRNGVGRFLTIIYDADNLKTDKACRDKARQLVESTAYQGVTATFDCLPVPVLEELDSVRLDMGSYHMQFKMSQWTLPLVATDAMSVGYTKHVRPRRHKKRH